MGYFIVTWWPAIYFAVVVLGWMVVFIWWETRTTKEKMDLVFWPQLIFISFWPIVLVAIIPISIIMGICCGAISLINKARQDAEQ